jgi:hypothetical protein
MRGLQRRGNLIIDAQVRQLKSPEQNKIAWVNENGHYHGDPINARTKPSPHLARREKAKVKRDELSGRCR